MKVINKTGINEIAKFLRRNHQKGEAIVRDKSMLDVYVNSAEWSINNGYIPALEIPEWDSLSWQRKSFNVSDAGIDTITIDDDDTNT